LATSAVDRVFAQSLQTIAPDQPDSTVFGTRAEATCLTAREKFFVENGSVAGCGTDSELDSQLEALLIDLLSGG
jgi:hypothetical protein